MKEKPCFQETGRGWWNESQVAQTIRTNSGGGGLIANLVLEKQHELSESDRNAESGGASRKL